MSKKGLSVITNGFERVSIGKKGYKMSNKFCLFSNDSVGCTFIDWSIYWLSGQVDFYCRDHWIQLVKNPLTQNNAHKHLKNHPSGFAETLEYIDNFDRIKNKKLLSMYPVPLGWEMSARELSLSIDDSIIEKNHNSVIEHTIADFAKTWELCHARNYKNIYIKFDSNPIYRLSTRNLSRQRLNKNPYQNEQDAIDDYYKIFFDSKVKDLTIWDRREFYSLNIRPYKVSNTTKKVNFSLPHLLLDAQEIWHNGEHAVNKIFNYLELQINKDKLSQWLPIYKQWQQRQCEILKFSWNFEHICKAIVDNFYYDIGEYKLNIAQEAAIQHVMLYKYNLNFKIWQLEKFPNNTQDLHKLLEPNTFHKLDNLYNI